MRPFLASSNRTYAGRSDSEARRNLPARFGRRADFAHGIISELGVAALGSVQRSLSTFAHAILLVVKGTTNEKMQWVYAYPDIAGVANVHSVRDWSAEQLVRDSVRIFRSSLVPRFSVSVVADTSAPYPTTVAQGFNVDVPSEFFKQAERLGAATATFFSSFHREHSSWLKSDGPLRNERGVPSTSYGGVRG